MTSTPYDGGALVIQLRATAQTVATLQQRKGGRISAFMGNAVHQAFHQAITDNTASVLHDPAIQFQPFATSGMFRDELDMPLYGRIAVGDMAWVRFVALHPYIMQEVDRFRRSNPRSITIDRVQWQVMTCTWQRHLYAQRFSAAERMAFHQRQPVPRLMKLRFLMPTVFKSKGIEPYLHPDPRLVLAEGLLRRWQNFYPHLPPPEGFAQFVQTHIHEKRRWGFAAPTVMVKNAVVKGFTGDVLYAIAPPADEQQANCARFAALMAEYATYAGVGKKTTMGLGMVDRVLILRR